MFSLGDRQPVPQPLGHVVVAVVVLVDYLTCMENLNSFLSSQGVPFLEKSFE